MAINFPNNPSPDDTHSHNGLIWKWDGTTWNKQFTSGIEASSDPIGTIVLWSGAVNAIPTGYQLCDGGASATTELQAIRANVPDLRDRFIVGAGDTYSVADTGGSADAVVVDHSHTGPSHNHTINLNAAASGSGTTSPQSVPHTHNVAGTVGPGGGLQAGGDFTGNYSPRVSGGDSGTSHQHSFNININATVAGNTGNDGTGSTSSDGVSGVGKNLPPYYALCYIIKNAASTGGSGIDLSNYVTKTGATLDINYTGNSTHVSGGYWIVDAVGQIELKSDSYVETQGTRFDVRSVDDLTTYARIDSNGLNLYNGGIRDKDGNLGGSGQILSSTGSKLEWINASSGGINLTDLSIGSEGSASGDGSIAYDDSTGVFTYTPPDLSSYLTGLPAHTHTLVGLTDTDLLAPNAPNDGEVLTYNSNDQKWRSDTVIGLTSFSIGSNAAASGNGGLAYNNTNGVFTYTPPNLSHTHTFIDLAGTPSSYEDGKWLKSTATGTVWDTLPVDTDTDTFAGLTDTPSTYTADKWLKVNAGGTALEFTDAPSGGGGGGINLDDLSVTLVSTPSGGGGLAYSDTTGVFTFTPAAIFSGSYADLTNKPNLFSGSYNDLTNKPAIPTNNNQLTNGAGYTTNTGTVTSVGLLGGTGLTVTNSPVTTSGNINIGLDAELNNLNDVNVGTAQSRTQNTYLRWTGAEFDLASPSGSSDGNDYVNSASLSSTTLTLGRTGSLSDLTVNLASINTDTTYNVVSAGNAGLCPALPASSTGKFLKDDATWETITTGGNDGNDYVDAASLSGTNLVIGRTGSLADLTVNLSSLSGGDIPSGTSMLFAQGSAPTGWTKSTTHDNKALRVVDGSGGGSGGNIAFTTAFSTQSISATPNGSTDSDGAETINVSGTCSGNTGNSGNPTSTIYLNVVTDDHVMYSGEIASHRHYTGKKCGSYNAGYGLVDSGTATSSGEFWTDWTGSNQSHHHAIYLHPMGNHQHGGASFSGNYSGSGSSSNHTHSLSAATFSDDVDLRVQYVDVIIASKD